MEPFVPAEVFPPGEYIRDELQARGWTQTDLAEVMDRPIQMVSELIRAKKRVTEDTAHELEAALDIEAAFWVRTEAIYRLHSTPALPRGTKQRAEIRRRVPLRWMQLRKWIPDTNDAQVLRDSVVKYLCVAKLDDPPSMQMAAKQTTYNEALTPAQEVWLLRVKQIAETMVTPSYSQAKLEEVITTMEGALSTPDGARHVPTLLHQAGVRFVVVERLPGLKTDGVCFWIRGNTQPVIGMSLTADRIDNFWFVVRHECEHVRNGDGKQGVMVDDDLDTVTATTIQEQRANAAAAEFCVPQIALQDFIDRKGPLFTTWNIRSFAQTQNRHPGLVAGQLRRRFKAWTKYQKELSSVRRFVLSTAQFDGFGSNPV